MQQQQQQQHWVQLPVHQPVLQLLQWSWWGQQAEWQGLLLQG
jgi:hypothetical protein